LGGFLGLCHGTTRRAPASFVRHIHPVLSSFWEKYQHPLVETPIFSFLVVVVLVPYSTTGRIHSFRYRLFSSPCSVRDCATFRKVNDNIFRKASLYLAALSIPRSDEPKPLRISRARPAYASCLVAGIIPSRVCCASI
jgi:hypothetical protein